MANCQYTAHHQHYLKVFNNKFGAAKPHLYLHTMRKLKYTLERFRWIKAMFSPFRPLTVKWYFGKTQVGVPYFYPRKLVKSKTKPGYNEFKPLTVGFDWCSLGYKTKWTDTDYRYEWPPIFTFVFFGYQIAAIIGPKVKDATSHYWEAWLYYEYATDKTKSKRKRIRQCRKRFPQTWRVSSQGKEEVIDYYQRILKSKYLK